MQAGQDFKHLMRDPIIMADAAYGIVCEDTEYSWGILLNKRANEFHLQIDYFFQEVPKPDFADCNTENCKFFIKFPGFGKKI